MKKRKYLNRGDRAVKPLIQRPQPCRGNATMVTFSQLG